MPEESEFQKEMQRQHIDRAAKTYRIYEPEEKKKRDDELRQYINKGDIDELRKAMIRVTNTGPGHNGSGSEHVYRDALLKYRELGGKVSLTGELQGGKRLRKYKRLRKSKKSRKSRKHRKSKKYRKSRKFSKKR